MGRAQKDGGQQPPEFGDAAVLRALLTEVRQLRSTLQRANLDSIRMQVAFERMRFQAGRVDVLKRDLENVRTQLASRNIVRIQISENNKEMEDQLDHENDLNRRAQLDRQLRQAKQTLSLQAKQEDQLRDRETQLSTQLQSEQVKSTELEENLANLERELATP